ncbi:MAG: fused DSP-PTPase phosphatase/NAD kinase-like protein [Hyphomicrobium sp.]
MLITDYGFVRLFFNNRHRMSADAWRSGQPAPHHLRHAARAGVKTVINLRGDQSFGTNWLEERACARHGLTLVKLKLRSRAAPTRDELRAIKTVLETVEYPVLMHCKSGADRAGLMSALYRIVHDGVPVADARAELGLKYGHIRQADTGVLDAVFDRYVADTAVEPMPFWTWVETRYDPADVERRFKARGWANRIVDGLLRRE